ncbi:cell surface protein [Halobacteriales archaeon QS_4_70_19]|nr:MAG: cell surface protein [Halobacteriales archaeon QS_4_70_19]
MPEFTRRNLMATSVAAAVGASVSSVAAADEDESDTEGAPSVKGELKRFSSTALGAEVTGPVVLRDGTPLYSLQHPSRDNPAPYDKGGVGYVRGFSFDLEGNDDGDGFDELPVPKTDEEKGRVRTCEGEYELLMQEKQPIDGGTERFGVTQTPDGTAVTQENFAGTQYGAQGINPDCNQFIPTNEAGTEGYLYTNFENSPGNVARTPVSRNDDGTWSADAETAINLANTDALRELGGTRINCYGDLTPWDTMVSSEEHYGHARVSLTATVGDIVEAGSGQGLRGAHEFWNRPNPSGIQDAVDEYYGEDSWYVQGYWNLVGVEFLAYYLGADSPNPSADENTIRPIGEEYPNPYRYGYHLEFRDATADEPTPVKHHVMGRAAWEAPDFQQDRKTVYGCSDGDSKGIYKFVADRPIPSYSDPMDVAGTLYAPEITTEAAAERNAPIDVPLDVEWLELGHASNREVESWIADYDGITQEDYLATHSDWEEGDEVTPAVLEEADREVAVNGNRDYISDEEIVEWAEQYEANGPDGVDEELRRVPFLETRAAAKEIGASIEFNKAEGVDSAPGATPGDYVYFGISEFNDDMADDTGDLRMHRVDGGVVYRGELEPDYNVSRLEPVIVGPDGTDAADVADDALVNVDNVRVMEDGRVLCCEDADQLGRSYKNDCLYVYTPEEQLGRPPANGNGDGSGSAGRERTVRTGAGAATFRDRDGDGTVEPTRAQFDSVFPDLDWDVWDGLFGK